MCLWYFLTVTATALLIKSFTETGHNSIFSLVKANTVSLLLAVFIHFTFSVPSMRSRSVSAQSAVYANQWDKIWDKGKSKLPVTCNWISSLTGEGLDKAH